MNLILNQVKLLQGVIHCSMDMGIIRSDTFEDKNDGGLIPGGYTGAFGVNLFGSSGENQMQTAVRRRHTIIFAVLTKL